MSPWVIFSDLHGRLAELDSLLIKESAGRFVCAGDVLGPTAHNGACVDALREKGVPTVQGNHEHQLFDVYRSGLTDTQREWVTSRPLELVGERFLVLHTLLDIAPGKGVTFWDIEHADDAIHCCRESRSYSLDTVTCPATGSRMPRER